MLSSATVLDLEHLKSHPTAYAWVDFRPNVKKLVLAGSEQREHVAILWYTAKHGAVARHYHAQTESIYVLEGTQADEKGVYRPGTLCFNPPGSAHSIRESTGFFILAYASAPDFVSGVAAHEYTPVTIDTTAADFVLAYPFVEAKAGVRVFEPDLGRTGGMSAQLMEIAASEGYFFEGNYLLVLQGSCHIEGRMLGPNTLLVTKTIEPRACHLTASKSGSCLALSIAFENQRSRQRQ